MDSTVLIATYNRAAHLEDTLQHLARVQTTQAWEVLVVDNNSSDHTPDVVRRMASGFPVPLRYLHEPVQGKYGALNSGIRASRGRLLAMTDDDARVEQDWLERAAAGLAEHDFVGGPVRPLWEGQPPRWLDPDNTAVQKVIAICDYGPVRREFGKGTGWPLGVNVAYRRQAFERAGLFDASLGRTAGTLRSQSQREWHLRARAAGLRGMYLPDMVVHHRVVADRLTRQYFRRWHYWHGISRASLYWRLGFDPQEPELLRHERPLPAIAGVPRHLFPRAALSLRSYAWRTIIGQPSVAFDYEMWLCFFAGLAVECRRLRRQPFGADRAAAGSTLAVPLQPAS